MIDTSRPFKGLLGFLGIAMALPVAGQTMSESDVVSRALKVNPKVLLANEKLNEARAHLEELRGAGKFQLSFGANLSGLTGLVAEPPSYQSFLTGEASLSAPIPNFAEVNAQVAAGRAGLDIALAELKRTNLDVEFAAEQAFIELRRAQEALDIAKANLDQSMRQADDTKKRIDAGDVPQADLLKAEVPVAQNRAALIRAKLAVSAAEDTLNDVLQHQLGSHPLIEAVLASPAPDPDEKAVMAYAEKNAPEILEAAAALVAAQSNERVVRRNRDPQYGLQLTHTRTSDPTAYAYVTSLALTISLPILDGGVAHAQRQQATSQVAQAKTQLDLAKQQVRVSVRQALLDFQGNEANLEATRATTDIAKESLEKARQSFAAGLTTTRDVLDAQLIYSQSLVELNSAKYDLELSRAHLKQLMGGMPA